MCDCILFTCMYTFHCSDIDAVQLLQFCREIADGMKYLSKKGFVHRDLAARNILLDKNLKCKVTTCALSAAENGKVEQHTYLASAWCCHFCRLLILACPRTFKMASTTCQEVGRYQ